MSFLSNWGPLEWSIALGFGIPMFILIVTFAVLACMISSCEREGNSTW